MKTTMQAAVAVAVLGLAMGGCVPQGTVRQASSMEVASLRGFLDTYEDFAADCFPVYEKLIDMAKDVGKLAREIYAVKKSGSVTTPAAERVAAFESASQAGLECNVRFGELNERESESGIFDPASADVRWPENLRERWNTLEARRTRLATSAESIYRKMETFLELTQTEAERKAREAEARRKRGGPPGTTFQDCPECPEMVVVPGGKFGQPFAVGVYEVTFAEWDACVSGGGCGGYRPTGGWGRGGRPVMNVSWDDAKAYVGWLSRKTGEGYRLLSESEWEYVARAGTTTAYWWGDAIGRNRANCWECGSRWDNRQTAPVGSFAANPFGLHDVHGNVWEWVEGCYEGDCSRRVLRGGSWNNLPRYLRSAFRNLYTTGGRSYDAGFRVARTITP